MDSLLSKWEMPERGKENQKFGGTLKYLFLVCIYCMFIYLRIQKPVHLAS